MIRLTKGRYHPPGNTSVPTLEFADLTKTSAPKPREERYADQLTLFLERPYLSGAGRRDTATICRLFVALVEKKGRPDAGCSCAGSTVYGVSRRRRLCASQVPFYVSKSKGGAQYLDSMGGENPSREGSFHAFPFLVPQKHALEPTF